MREKELFPPFPEPFLPCFSAAKRGRDRGALTAIEFSRRTYQAQVRDFEDKEEYWSFLHLDDKGELAESFCLCSEIRGEEHCSHVLTALLGIYNKGLIPLHARYEKSLLRTLFFHLFQEAELSFSSLGKKIRLRAKSAKGAAIIEEIAAKEKAIGEEESLQFSDLVEAELESIEKKRMSLLLRFHFSCYNELAKSLFVMGELGEEYSFQKDRESSLLSFQSDAIEFSLKVSEEIFPEKEFGAGLVEIALDEEKKQLLCRYREHEEQIEENEIAPFLTLRGLKLQKWAAFSMGSEEPLFIQREGAFDEEGNLHIDPYLKSPGDLKTALFFDRWIYTKKEGFRPISGPLVAPEKIPREEVEGYVLAHQSDLEEIIGFRFHKTPIQQKALFFVDGEGNLHLEKGGEKEELSQDETRRVFGRILYIPYVGFYPLAENLGFPEGIIPKRKVASFLRKHQKELEMIPGFFLDKSPLLHFSVDVGLKEGEITLLPQFTLTTLFQGEAVRGYEGWIYVKDKGFFSLAAHLIPYELMEAHAIEKEEIPRFFEKEWEKILTYAGEIDSRLIPIRTPEIELRKLAWSEEQMRWDVSLFYGGVPIEELWKIKTPYYFGENGRIDLEEREYIALKRMLSNPSTLSPLELIRLLFSAGVRIDPSCEERAKSLLQLRSERPPDLHLLKSTLRDYQKKAVDWLWFLYSHRLSALLADDMGLGKTHEAMGLIAAIFASGQEKEPSCLIVCPTSLLFHWEEKLAAFLPDKRVHVFWGKERLFKKEEILLTSYTIFRRDYAQFAEASFSLAIFDEVQLAKNHQSRLSHVVKEIKARMKLGLSGTPIENRLRELKTLFDLLLPGLMPKEEEFYQQFAIPIEREGNRTAEEAFQRRIRPFIMRRTKKEVLKELPEKIEEVEKATMEEDQRLLYEKILDQAKKGILHELLEGEKPKSLIPIFAVITQLKKICNHPALFYKDVAGYKQYSSGKWELFKELVEEALASEQKVVVFSHFLQMLDIIELYLKEENVGFSRLRGETKNRKEEVMRFQQDPNCRVFVASLQAGGLGIDLTAASVVIHYDRWWNFAKENQATDRVHRIGQTRGVQVFKLMTVSTIEEHIDNLIRKKANLHEKMVGQDEVELIKSFSVDDLRFLFDVPQAP